jgi:hypothetical protein
MTERQKDRKNRKWSFIPKSRVSSRLLLKIMNF